jgi:flagellar biosynthetic protein FlhB
MADDAQDDSQKTEEPTQKRLDEAREKGDVAASREVANWFMLAGAAVVVGLILPFSAGSLSRSLAGFLEHPHAFAVDPAALARLFGALSFDVALALALPMALLVACAAGAGLVQHGVVFTAEKLKPSLDKISPIAGARRMFSLRSVAELIKGLIKITVVAAVAWFVIEPALPYLDVIPARGLGGGMALLHDLTTRILVGVVIAMTFLALFDYFYQRFEHARKLRMSKQEIRDEYKQMEGDPQIKARLRSIRMERARQRMMQAVPDADVVITNPTHYAVALQYDQATMVAPKLIAKGIDAVALRIREKAESCDIAVIENKLLARTLYGSVDIGETIKPEHYRAVAEIIAFVMGIGGRPGGQSGVRPAPPLTR